MKVFLTGATGFIGSQVARLLIREECTVYALIRPTSNPWRIRDILPSLQVIYDDFVDPKNNLITHLTKIQPEIALHLAWNAVPGEYLHTLENVSLLSASLKLATQLASVGCQKMLATGTCFEYDHSGDYLSESSPTKPTSLYAASKLACQMVLQHYAQFTKMQMVWLRFFYQYGPFEDERRRIPSVILSLLRGEEVKTTSGNVMRDYLHVEDVASAVWAVTKSNLTGIVNIGSGKPASFQNMISQIGKILGKSNLVQLGALPADPKDPPFICANNSKLRENTPWKPHYSLEQGLQHTIEWWKNESKLFAR